MISDTKKKINNIPLFLLIKEYNTSTKDDNSYEHWLHVIGKQIKKDEKSKYFEQNESLHFNNGNFDKNNEDGINNLIIEDKRLFDSCKKDSKKPINEFVETLICDKRYDISRK